MFDLFNKKKTQVIVIEDPKPHTDMNLKSSYSAEVLQIHYEFHTASDNLIIEAKGILANAASKNVNKVISLEQLGFKQAREVSELKPLLQQAELSKDQLESLAYYQRKYPLQKFITEEQVMTICHKYNLVCGDVGRFKGFVPDKNLKEIVKFKIRPEDDPSPKLGETYIILDSWILLHVNDVEKAGYRITNKFAFDAKVKYAQSTNYYYVGLRSSGGGTDIPGYAKIFKYTERHDDSDIKKVIEKNTNSLKICAPIKDMDISGLSLSNGYKLEREHKHIPDPVVLQKVKHGYLILTAWGDEASDPLVVNNINN